MKLSDFSINILIAVISSFLFIPFIGSVHLFDWDEINFAECAREMIVSGDYLFVKINYQPFWEKPPLFIWMQAVSMNVFGINEFAARLPDALCGIITLLVVFNIGKRIYDTKFGILWSLIYAGSFLPHFYFKSGIIDPWFNLFVFSGIYFFIHATNEEVSSKNNLKIILSAFFIGLAILTKGPVAMLIFASCCAIYWFTKKFLPIISSQQIFIFLTISILVGGVWFVIEILTGKFSVIVDFLNYQLRLLSTEDSGHGGPFFYHFIVLLIGCFPASILALKAFKKYNSDTPFQKHFKTWMIVLLCVTLFIFSVVQTKIIHYSSLCYFPLTYLAAYTAHKIINYESGWKTWMSSATLVIGGMFGIIFTMLPFTDGLKEKIISARIIHDEFALANLQAQVHWNAFDYFIGPVFLIALLWILLAIKKRNPQKKIIALFSITLLTVNVACIAIAPKVEQYSQGAAIEFFKSMKGKDCYVETVGYMSYAHLFYTEKKEPTNPNSYSIDWLLHEQIDKPAYFVSKITDETVNKEQYPLLEELYRKNGFIFYKRK